MFLKNKNIIFKIGRSKVTDYAALIALVNNVDTDQLASEESIVWGIYTVVHTL